MTFNGDTPGTTDSGEVLEEPGKTTPDQLDEPASHALEKEPPTQQDATSMPSSGNGEPRDALQPGIQAKTALPAVYSDIEVTSTNPPRSDTAFAAQYIAALVLTGSVVPVPFVALVLTAAFYILPTPSLFDYLTSLQSWLPRSGMDIIYGFVFTIILWLVVSFFLRFATTRENANSNSCNHINSHLLSLKTAFRGIQEAQQTYNELADADRATAKIAGTIDDLRNYSLSYYDASAEKVRECLSAVEQELQKGGSYWLAGSGYLNAWTYIHRAEEAMITIAPVEEVIKEAFHDDSSIDGSAIPTRDDLLNRLRLAVRKLSPAAGIYMKPPAIEPPAPGASINDQDPPDSKTAMNARIAIRDVKLTLNEFRDALWDGLVRVRNLLVTTATLTGWLSYVLLSSVLLLGATIPEIQAALIFYLVGAFTGTFSRLITESQTDTEGDDYGLTVARIVVTPLIAGLAALAGVFLLAILSVNLLKSPTATSTTIPTLEDIYSITKNPQGLLSAAIFGLTPNLFISVLQQQADVVKTKLKNSSASDQGNN